MVLLWEVRQTLEETGKFYPLTWTHNMTGAKLHSSTNTKSSTRCTLIFHFLSLRNCDQKMEMPFPKQVEQMKKPGKCLK